MTEKSIIIVGAGLAGLGTGIYGQMNGYRTQIFEHHTKPGGVCTGWQRKGYTIDGCIHWLMGAKSDSWLNRVYREVGALEGNPLRVMKHFARYIDEATGQRLDLTEDLDRLEADMKSLSPEDSQVIEEVVNGARLLQGFDISWDKPAEAMGPPDDPEFFVRYSMSVAEFLGPVRNPLLKWALSTVFMPEMPVAFMFTILGQVAAGQMALVEGGSLNFSLRVAKRYENLGGKVTYGATVDEILVEDDQAVGVRLADGSEHRGDIVVSCADGYSTIYKMLGGRYVDQTIEDRYTNWQLFPPILMISFGVANSFPGEASSNRVLLQRPITIGHQEFDGFGFRIFNWDSTLAPPGKTVVQVILNTDCDWWCELQEKDRPRYDAEKQRFAKDVLGHLEKYLPGITPQVELTDIATPYTFWRYTRNHRGSFEGWAMTPDTLGKQVEKTLPGLNNFYMAGQWVEPGGGVGPALYSGRNVVQTLCHQDGKEFSTAIP